MTLDPETVWTLPVSPEAREALTAAGEPHIPEVVILHLREATGRELTRLELAQVQGGVAHTDPYGFTAELIRRRASEPVSEAVAREVAQDLTPTELGELVWAYREGRRDPTGKVAGAVRATLTGLSDRMLSALGSATSPFSATSTG